MRLILLCIIAAKLPTNKEATAKIASMGVQSFTVVPKPVTKIRKANTTAAIFGTVPTKAATEVGAP